MKGGTLFFNNLDGPLSALAPPLIRGGVGGGVKDSELKTARPKVACRARTEDNIYISPTTATAVYGVRRDHGDF